MTIRGWLVLDKPLHLSSAQALYPLKSLLKGFKVGHAGTLDPLATGVLVIGLGDATKLMSYAVEGLKSYEFAVAWGQERDTHDAGGIVVESSPKRPLEADIALMLPHFFGEIQQLPPEYSALKIQGKRACDLMRRGQEVRLEPRSVGIHDLQVLSHTEAKTVFQVTCGPGTYVRSLARDFGRHLGCYGHVRSLRRTAVGSFGIEKAVNMEKILALEQVDEIRQYLERFDAVLDDIPALVLDDSQISKLRQGLSLTIETPAVVMDGPVVCKDSCGITVALGVLENRVLKPKRNFTTT